TTLVYFVLNSPSPPTWEPSMPETRDVVHDYILKTFLPGEDPSELTDETPLITGGILDSISTLKLVVFLEEHFGIRIEAYEAGAENLDSISQIAALIVEKQQEASSTTLGAVKGQNR